MVHVNNPSRNTRDTDRETRRLTAFYKFDARDHLDGFLGKLIGKQSLTGLYNEYEIRDERIGYQIGQSSFSGPSIDTLTFDATRTGAFYGAHKQYRHFVHFGPSLAPYNSRNDPNLPQIQSVPNFQLYNPDLVLNGVRLWNPGADPDSNLDDFIGSYTVAYDEFARGAGGQFQHVDSKAWNLQSSWWDGLLTTVWGYRTDKVARGETTLSNNTSIDTDGDGEFDDTINLIDEDATWGLMTEYLADPRVYGRNTVEGDDLWTYSAVLHQPEFIKLPGEANISLHYGKSDNFNVGEVASDIHGNFISPPAGSTEEYGFSLSLFENRLHLRANWYETKIENSIGSSDIRDFTRYMAWNGHSNVVNNILGNLDNLPRPIPFVLSDFQNASERYESTYDTFLEAAHAYVNDVIPGNIVDTFDVRFDETQGDNVGRYIATVPSSLNSTEGLVSEGMEIEAVYNITDNWRALLNVSQTEAVVSNRATEVLELYD